MKYCHVRESKREREREGDKETTLLLLRRKRSVSVKFGVHFLAVISRRFLFDEVAMVTSEPAGFSCIGNVKLQEDAS